ncbi:asparagine synthase-related protein [Pseudomonas capsici]|uniref:asparagine synthase-related protein n=1 Tax=Pseudomonas capsici TaxID=2810614 RepID=UPI0019103ED7|nr:MULTISPECIES: asparagine synthetase B [Pseudomonas]MBX8610492.1 asparagine synthetase B [Pseudomonas cichorii]MCV4263217.1 asparagine synthetase B [Pseudomonas capsici]MCV4272025.1 asparagine synthetase B [Pseudomonas capsici]MCV4339652.1 asparagine synthetase B [Pseudomonas capsici]GFM55152.1 asparagine synthase [Pseudomonas cichorii]
MCGILGYFAPDYDLARFQQALRLVNHRGPYGQGFVSLANGALGMARLPMSGNAPAAVPPQVGLYTAAYNGEVYAPGHQLGDEIESLIAGLQQGAAPDGMYAIAYWNELSKELVIYRDSFGIKPLYYIYRPERELLAFASEIKPLLHLLKKVSIDRQAVAQIVSTGVSLDFSTLVKDIKLVRPGEKLTFVFTEFGFRLRRTERVSVSFAQPGPDTEDLIVQSINRCRDTFRPTALLVSGGVDSNLLGSFLEPGFSRFNLAVEGAEEAPNSLDDTTRLFLKEETFMTTLRSAVSSFGSASRMTSLLMYQALADGIGDAGYHSVIVGEGADEIFWGYSRHVDLWHRRHDLAVTDFAQAWFGRYRQSSMIAEKTVREALCEQVEDLARDTLAEGFEKAVMRFDMDYSLEPLLRRSDHLLMGRTIEARTPFLHAGLPYSVPFERLIEDGHGKAKLYELLKKRIPTWESRPKKHFRAPLVEWKTAQQEMRTHLKENLGFLEDAGLTGVSDSLIDDIDVPQLFTMTTLSIWGQEYGAYL